MNKPKISLLAAAVAALLSGWCLSGCHNDRHANEAEPVRILRLDRAFAEYAGADSAHRAELAEAFADEAVIYGQLMGLGPEVDPDSAMLDISATRMMRIFQPDVENRLPELDSVERVLGNALANLQTVAPKAHASELVGIVWPYQQKIVVADDSLVYIALNHYLGTDYDGYRSMPRFEAEQRRIDRLPFDVAEALIGVNYPAEFDGNTQIISRMLYDGAVVNAIVESVPGADVWSVMDYSPEQRYWLEKNESMAWNSLIANDLIYSTSDIDATRLLRPSPASLLVSADAPPRIGRFLGYRIVKSYLDRHPSVTAEQLLMPSFFLNPGSLIDSAYSPR